jgi:uncharacterized MAPEG superfamily protein
MTIALWCLLAAALLPIVTVGIAKAKGGNYDNGDPRGGASRYEGMAKRAYAAHQNGFEAFPLFAAAVLIAEMKGGPRGMVDLLAFAHVALRASYTGAYVLDKPSLRSLLWIAALVCTLLIFTSPLWK